jgi:GNAT superfamily N-acetyltransferase
MFRSKRLEDPDDVADLKAEHLETLTAPLDAYWEEALIGMSDHFELTVDGIRAGYFCLNADRQMTAFHLVKQFISSGSEALPFVIREHGIDTAFAGTNDPIFLSLCLDIAKRVEVHTLLFEDGGAEGVPAVDDAVSFKKAGDEDIDAVLKHYLGASGAIDTESIEAAFEGLQGYVRSVMDQHRIFVLRKDGEILATSECRISKTQRPYADVGMIVAEAHRRNGFGSHILSKTRDVCRGQGLIPICSCEVTNTGSRKAILKAGFVARHRIVKAEFTVGPGA